MAHLRRQQRRYSPAGAGRLLSAVGSRVPRMDSRLRALCDLSVAESREYAGRHEYDGRVQDLSPDGVRRGLAALGGDPSRTRTTRR